MTWSEINGSATDEQSWRRNIWSVLLCGWRSLGLEELVESASLPRTHVLEPVTAGVGAVRSFTFVTQFSQRTHGRLLSVRQAKLEPHMPWTSPAGARDSRQFDPTGTQILADTEASFIVSEDMVHEDPYGLTI